MKKLCMLLLCLIPSVGLASDLTKVDLSGKRPLTTVTLSHVDSSRVAVLKGEVRQWNIDAINLQLEEFAKNPTKPAYLDIDSPGGSIRAGLSLIHKMQNLKAAKGLNMTCVVTGSAYSMAGLIASYCSSTYMTSGSDMMFHGASYSVGGNANQVLLRVLFITQWLNELDIELANQMGLTYHQYMKARGEELWLTATEAVKYGFADGLVKTFYHTATPPEPPKAFTFIFGFEQSGADFDYITIIPPSDLGSVPNE